ncbi:phosphatidylserine/phosphatidylglycerophosphate/cardiolipin synthase-like enzyme [Azospirillum agricola]|uniref:phospholipase D-like domain-containing protein n=1 Tax=Azospirillum agricola TaxID=1720247 RepID=UPI001AE9F40A|nr:phospholipase D-like domain-containing protein [Azospirillum agricola]MBP2228264.1 phosphatidylserine/phosphatidylglycerophosphate/cardiolipin synthase-like enzyme [Azospirillum agricola]
MPDDSPRPPFRTRPGTDGPVLRPGDTCWRIERAGRLAVLVDGAAFFAAARAAMEAAQRSILLVGWDIEPRMRLDPDRPENLGQFLARLVRERPELRVRALKWDMPFPITLEHPHEPLEDLDHSTGRRLNARLDGELPVGAAQHQKILAIDDALAFCGGIDLAGDRWDTPEHRDDEPRRRWPTGEPYAPRHDVMMMVDGAAAGALADLARERWRRATGETLVPCPPPDPDPWPAQVAPDLTGATVGVSRTVPEAAGHPAIRESEALIFAAIAAAERTIYLENQYFASAAIADALARRLAEPDGPEVVLVLPMESPSWFDRMAMDTTRSVALRCLREADRHGRLRAMTPVTPAGTGIVVHSKIVAVDGRLLRVGSSNLNNRSMGYDTECDLTVEAAPGDHAVAEAIVGTRDRLLAEHLAVEPAILSATVKETGSLIAAMDRLGKETGRRLVPLPATDPSLTEQAFAALRIADPGTPDEAWAVWKRIPLPAPARPVLNAAAAALMTAGIALGVWGAVRTLDAAGMQEGPEE